MFKLGYIHAGPVADPFWTSVVTLLHMNGVDASTTFTDATGKHTWAAQGNAQIDTAQYKFGGASGLFDGTGDWLKTANSTDFQFGTGDFTIEFWVRFNAVSGIQNFIGWLTAAGAVQLLWEANRLEFYGQTGFVFQTAWTPVINTWYSVALTRSGNSWRPFVNGTQLGGTVTDSRSLGLPNAANGIGIAAEVSAPSQFVNGWLDEFRVTKGVARYTANYTPATLEFPDF